MPHISRFKRRNSDRSGFKFFEIELVKDGPWKVSQDEYDTPPPSKKSLGGEGDVSLGEIRDSSESLDIPTGLDNPVHFITAAAGITPDFNHPFMYVTGSNSDITLSANPQIVRGIEGQVLTLVGVGSSITVDNGTGLNLMGSNRFIITSGATLGLIYTSGGSVWNETFRTYYGGF